MLDLKKKKILITGGLGMIGSTVANKLVAKGANVTILDAVLEPYGANFHNVKEIEDKIDINICDIRDLAAINHLVKNKDIIFCFAAQVSHNDSIINPYLDAQINYIGHLNILEACKRFNPKAVLLYSGSRLQYGEVFENPVPEDTPLRPKTPYAVNKTSAENLYLYYHRMYGIPVVLFRIANPYGPRCQMKHSKYSIINWFIRLAMDGKALTVFGDGSQIRDYVYVDDVAEIFIKASMTPKAYGQVFNLGSGIGAQFKDMVRHVVKIVGKGTLKYVEWPDNYINVETGDFIADISKLKKVLNVTDFVSLKEGIKKTVSFYKKHKNHYWV